MASPPRARPTRLPRLRMRDELLKADPTLAKYLDQEPLDPVQAGHGQAAPPSKTLVEAALIDEELTEEQLLNLELEAVKRERASLFKSLAVLKTSQEKTGAKIQEDDIRVLRQELDAKMSKVNELREEAKLLEGKVEKYEVAKRDCALLMPDGQPENNSRIAELTAQQTALEAELVEHEAKNRLYLLLAQRTRREHDDMERQVGQARATLAAFQDDLVTLNGHAADVRASREEADRALAAAKRNDVSSQADWHRKLHDRRKEVHEIEHRQQQKTDMAAAQAEAAAKLERQERVRQARLHKEELAHEQKLLDLQPQLESMEASWFRLHAITAADTAEEVVAFWEGLQAQERAMRELVRLAEEREAQAKAALAHLLESRSTALEESGNATASTEEESLAAERSDGGAAAALQEKIADAQRRLTAAEKSHARLRTVCTGAEQGLKSLQQRLHAALSEVLEPASREARASRGLARSSASIKQDSLRKSTSIRKTTSLRREGSAKSEASSPAVVPEGGSSATVFFPQLEGMLQEVGSSVKRLLALEAGMGLATHEDKHVPAGAAVLMRGMRRRTWTGPAWLNLTSGSQAMSDTMGWKRAKGKKKGKALQPDLSRIYGYINDADENDADMAGNTIQAAPAAELKFIDREFLKHRANKLLTAKHRQKTGGAGGRHHTAPPSAAR